MPSIVSQIINMDLLDSQCPRPMLECQSLYLFTKRYTKIEKHGKTCF